MNKILFFSFIAFYAISCNKVTKAVQTTDSYINVPAFCADSAYKYIQQQVNFGPRVPNTQAHLACSKYLSSTLRRFGAEVIEQKADLTAFDGTVLHCTNVIGSYNTKAETRILLCAHWDSRPWADNDPQIHNHKKPVVGANDGASGVGVLLEMARQFHVQQPKVGIDIIFFDAEDYGNTRASMPGETENTWCLGTQYWTKNQHIIPYQAKYGILLDMVGAPQATFLKEQFSEHFALHVVQKVWAQANSLGYGQYFLDKKGASITDDHLYINKNIGIPCIDIIQYDTENGFGSYWHTIDDTMKNIDKNTLQAVGATLMHVVYNETM